MTTANGKDMLETVASKVLERLDDVLRVMQRAAEGIASGKPPEEIDISGLPLYMARSKEDQFGRVRGVVYAMDYDQYMEMLDQGATGSGLCLEELTELEVNLPQMEFGEDLVTGGFEDFKGICVERHNQCILELMEAVSILLQRRGLSVACVPDEDVLFYLPLK
jgi:hypothetical protein